MRALYSPHPTGISMIFGDSAKVCGKTREKASNAYWSITISTLGWIDRSIFDQSDSEKSRDARLFGRAVIRRALNGTKWELKLSVSSLSPEGTPIRDANAPKNLRTCC